MLTCKQNKAQEKKFTSRSRYSTDLQHHTALQLQLPAREWWKLEGDYCLLRSVPCFLPRHLCAPTQYSFMGLSPNVSDYSGLVHNPFMWEKVCCAQPLHKKQNLGSSQCRRRGGRRSGATWPQTLTTSATEEIADFPWSHLPPSASVIQMHVHRYAAAYRQMTKLQGVETPDPLTAKQ